MRKLMEALVTSAVLLAPAQHAAASVVINGRASAGFSGLSDTFQSSGATQAAGSVSVSGVDNPSTAQPEDQQAFASGFGRKADAKLGVYGSSTGSCNGGACDVGRTEVASRFEEAVILRRRLGASSQTSLLGVQLFFDASGQHGAFPGNSFVTGDRYFGGTNLTIDGLLQFQAAASMGVSGDNAAGLVRTVGNSTNWINPTNSLFGNTHVFFGHLPLNGDVIELVVRMYLSGQTAGDAVFAANNTAGLWFDVPTDYELVSSSGVFLTEAARFVPPGAIPEPSTWALMIGGFALVGGSMRRRRRSARPALA